MDNLEKFITGNAGAFDDAEPDPGHFKKFSHKLEEESGRAGLGKNRGLMLKVAAAILVLITATVVVFDLSMDHFSRSIGLTGSAAGISDEMKDAMIYYDGLTKSRLGEFNKLACCGEEQAHLNSIVSSQLGDLDANISELKQSLMKDPDNENVQAALIRNQQMKNQVLDNMISQMKRSKERN